MNWYLEVLKKYAVFGGRARRKEYWYFVLFNFLIAIVPGFIDGVIASFSAEAGIGILSGLYALVLLIPSLAVTVRRLHDTNHSGWWILSMWLVLIIGVIGSIVPSVYITPVGVALAIGLPAFFFIIGNIAILIFLVQDSQPGENQYGPNPKAEAAVAVRTTESMLLRTTPAEHKHSMEKQIFNMPTDAYETPDFYQTAWDELADGSVQKGLWARVFSQTDGDNQRARALYIKLRVPLLEQEYAERQALQRKDIEQKLREEEIREEENRRIKEEMSRPENMGKTGLLVCSVDNECQTFGIQTGDVIISYNELDVRDNKALFLQQLEISTPSESINMRLVRGRQFVSMVVRGGRLGLQVAQFSPGQTAW